MTLLGATSKAAPVLHLSCEKTNNALVVAFKKGLTAKIFTDVLQDELEVSHLGSALLKNSIFYLPPEAYASLSLLMFVPADVRSRSQVCSSLQEYAKIDLSLGTKDGINQVGFRVRQRPAASHLCRRY